MTHAHLGGLADLIVALASALPPEVEDPVAGVRLACQAMDLSVPLEARLSTGGVLLAQLPRGRLATGFDLPLGRLSARFVARAA